MSGSDLEKEMERYSSEGIAIGGEGFRAAIRNMPPSANPFEPGHWQHDLWLDGWNEGQQCKQGS